MSRPLLLDLFCGAGGAAMGQRVPQDTCPECISEWVWNHL